MRRYIIRRLIGGIGLLFIVSAVIFLIFYVFPTGDPAVSRAGRQATQSQIDQIRQSLGLDKPIYYQYWIYMKDLVLHFDLGYSYQSNVPVRDLIFRRAPVTGLLVAGAAVLWLLIGIPTGIISATKRHSLLDRTTMVTTLALISAPVFWLGLVFLYLFADDVGRFPILPGIGSYIDANTFLEKCHALILPWIVLASATAAIYTRYVRSSLLDVMSEDYIRTARAKGLGNRRVILAHGMRSAMGPVVTLLGVDVGVLLAGNAILTETVFNVPGIGRLIESSINRADLPTIQGVVLMGAVFIVLFNLLVDIAYAYLDPRVRY